MIEFYYTARVSIISRPQYIEPAHFDMHQIGEATEGEELVEFAGRLCYLSHQNPAERTTREYLDNIKRQGHGSVVEHANYSMLIEHVSRTFTHELVRHRAGMAYSQVSQRFVDSSNVGFVMPPLIQDSDVQTQSLWKKQMGESLDVYEKFAERLARKLEVEQPLWTKTLRRKRAREAARSVLANATETKIVATGNVRAWRNILVMRGAEGADAEIRRWAFTALDLLRKEAPGFFDDMEIVAGSITTPYVKI